MSSRTRFGRLTLCVSLALGASASIFGSVAGCGPSDSAEATDAGSADGPHAVRCNFEHVTAGFTGSSNMHAEARWSCDGGDHYEVQIECSQSGPYTKCTMNADAGAAHSSGWNGVCSACLNHRPCVPELAAACGFPY